MSERFRLFVYGHLRRGQVGYELLGLAQHVQWLGEAQVQGRLYDLGDYPGLILGGEDIVHGELLGFDDPQLWAVLDDYETCDPERPDQSEYRREQIELIDGLHAWVYIYTRPMGGKPVISDGMWRVS